MQKKWRAEVGQDWNETGGSHALFYYTIKKGLPADIQKKLDEVVGMEQKPWMKIQAHIIHYFRQLEGCEKDRKEQITRNEAKLVHQQLYQGKLHVIEAAVVTNVTNTKDIIRRYVPNRIPWSDQRNTPDRMPTRRTGQCWNCEK